MKGLIKDPSPFLGGKSTLSINMNMHSTFIGGKEKYLTNINIHAILVPNIFFNFILLICYKVCEVLKLKIIMRITIDIISNELMTGPGDIYAKEIAGAGNSFAYAIYMYSKLPLRVFEAARIATAMMNGCKVCMAWQSKTRYTSDGYLRGSHF